ncbi:MAG TPA: hypothetical protein VIK56_09990 [Rhodoferax sp.]
MHRPNPYRQSERLGPTLQTLPQDQRWGVRWLDRIDRVGGL